MPFRRAYSWYKTHTQTPRSYCINRYGKHQYYGAVALVPAQLYPEHWIVSIDLICITVRFTHKYDTRPRNQRCMRYRTVITYHSVHNTRWWMEDFYFYIQQRMWNEQWLPAKSWHTHTASDNSIRAGYGHSNITMHLFLPSLLLGIYTMRESNNSQMMIIISVCKHTRRTKQKNILEMTAGMLR